MTALLKKTVGEIVAGNQHAAQLFELLGIDYASHGRLSLRDACASAGLDTLKIKRSLEQLPNGPTQNWFDRTLAELVTYLAEEQHPVIRTATAQCSALLAPPHCEICDEYVTEVDRLRVLFGGLRDVLHRHMGREEHVLFPVIVHFDECWARAETPSMRLTGGISSAVAALVAEHEQLTRYVNDIQQIAMQMTARDRRCTELLRALHELTHKVREHIHLQNNILYPRAAALECVMETTMHRPPNHRGRPVER